jgi:hypothetical protein
MTDSNGYRASPDVIELSLSQHDQVKQLLAKVHADLEAKFDEFRRAVLRNAEDEEDEEFPLLRQGTPDDQLVKIADDVITAQAEIG